MYNKHEYIYIIIIIIYVYLHGNINELPTLLSYATSVSTSGLENLGIKIGQILTTCNECASRVRLRANVILHAEWF